MNNKQEFLDWLDETKFLLPPLMTVHEARLLFERKIKEEAQILENPEIVDDPFKKPDKEEKMKAVIKWTLEFEYDLAYLEGFNIDDIQYYIEHSLCQENLLDFLADKRDGKHCFLCSIGKVDLLGIIK